MWKFRLDKHYVKEAFFVEKRDKEKKNNIDVGVEGEILIPKSYDSGKYVAVQLKIHIGNPEERLYLKLETVSSFEIEKSNSDFAVTEENVKTECLPIALAELRKTVKNVTSAYGMQAMELPPFEDENS